MVDRWVNKTETTVYLPFPDDSLFILTMTRLIADLNRVVFMPNLPIAVTERRILENVVPTSPTSLLWSELSVDAS